jgi:subtilisin family serine protease
VLAVGALSGPAEIAPFSSKEPRRQKPEIFAPQTMDGTALQGWIESIPDVTQIGTSYAAYQVAAAAILVWATHSERGPAWVRDVLVETARVLPSTYKRYRVRAVDVGAALDRAREDLVTDILGVSGSLSLPELLAGVGLPGFLTDQALDRLVARGVVVRSATATTENYELAAARLPA